MAGRSHGAGRQPRRARHRHRCTASARAAAQLPGTLGGGAAELRCRGAADPGPPPPAPGPAWTRPSGCLSTPGAGPWPPPGSPSRAPFQGPWGAPDPAAAQSSPAAPRSQEERAAHRGSSPPGAQAPLALLSAQRVAGRGGVRGWGPCPRAFAALSRQGQVEDTPATETKPREWEPGAQEAQRPGSPDWNEGHHLGPHGFRKVRQSHLLISTKQGAKVSGNKRSSDSQTVCAVCIFFF